MTAQCAGRPQVPVAAALLVLATLLSCAAPTSVAFETGPSSVTPAALATGGTHGGNVATVNSGASRSLLARAVQSESIGEPTALRAESALLWDTGKLLSRHALLH